MAIEWSSLGPELLVRLDRSARAPLRAQLEASDPGLDEQAAQRVERPVGGKPDKERAQEA